MSKLLKLSLVFSVFSLYLSASPDIGQKILERKLQKGCSISIADLAAKHKQREWKELKDSGKLRSELQKFEPKLKAISDKELPDVFDFLYEYASDSGLFPSCGG